MKTPPVWRCVERKGSERFLQIRISFTEEPADLSIPPDGKFKRDLTKLLLQSGGAKSYDVMMGTAKLAWEDDLSRQQCIAHNAKKGRDGKSRWENILDYVGRMRSGEFPSYGFVLFDTDRPVVKVLDGTRRSIAFLEFGQTDIPVRIVRPC